MISLSNALLRFMNPYNTLFLFWCIVFATHLMDLKNTYSSENMVCIITKSVDALDMMLRRRAQRRSLWWYWISVGQHSNILSLLWPIFNTWRPRQLRHQFSNTFTWMKMYENRLRFHWSLFLSVQLTIFHHWSIKWLGADQTTSHYVNQW